jgi:hypothetical protein
MESLSISHQVPYTSIKIEGRGIGGGIFQGEPSNIRNSPEVAQDTHQKNEISQMRRTL